MYPQQLWLSKHAGNVGVQGIETFKEEKLVLKSKSQEKWTPGLHPPQKREKKIGEKNEGYRE